jgi:ubiquinol-cytochrome c reductase iron-sulfur subunit
VARQAGLDLKRTPKCSSPSRRPTARWPTQFQAHRFPTPEYALNEWRSLRQGHPGRGRHLPHLGCSPSRFQSGPQPSLPDDWQGGFLCPCHGSTFDMAGRVFKNKPAPDNLQVPRTCLSDTKLVIGKDEKGRPDHGAFHEKKLRTTRRSQPRP